LRSALRSCSESSCHPENPGLESNSWSPFGHLGHN
jgi:hypothetical protein